MKRFLLIGSLVAVVVAMLALPALAQNRFDDKNGNDLTPRQFERQFSAFLSDWQGDNSNWWDRNNNDNNNNDWWNHNNWWDHNNNNDRNNNDNNNNDRNNNGPVISQESEQNVQSGDAKQSINVTGGGDNSNQCAGVQGITNTGNATNQTSVLQYGNDGAGVGVDDSGNFTINPSSTTVCDQQVNQAASASGW